MAEREALLQLFRKGGLDSELYLVEKSGVGSGEARVASVIVRGIRNSRANDVFEIARNAGIMLYSDSIFTVNVLGYI